MHFLPFRVVVVTAMVVGVVVPRPSAALSLCLVPPVRAPIVVSFQSPECPYCSGQRGIEYAMSPRANTAVLAAASGVVTFAGIVAQTRYVVTSVGLDVLITYGMLADSPLHPGDQVRTGQLIGRVRQRLYFGVRRSGVYADPVPLFAVATHRQRLVPADGHPARPARSRPPSCPTVARMASRTPWPEPDGRPDRIAPGLPTGRPKR